MNKTISQGQTLRNKWKDTRTDFFWWRFAHMFNNLLMSFIFKLFKEVKFLTSYNYWEFGIITSTAPTLQRLKNATFLLSILKTPLFLKIFSPTSRSNFAPPPHESTSCATDYEHNWHKKKYSVISLHFLVFYINFANNSKK